MEDADGPFPRHKLKRVLTLACFGVTARLDQEDADHTIGLKRLKKCFGLLCHNLWIGLVKSDPAFIYPIRHNPRRLNCDPLAHLQPLGIFAAPRHEVGPARLQPCPHFEGSRVGFVLPLQAFAIRGFEQRGDFRRRGQ